MFIKYKDKEYNIELSKESLIQLKNSCYNNEFYYLFKYLVKFEEFSAWFYSEYKDYSEFMKYPNKCVRCGKPSVIEYCKNCQNTDEFYEWRTNKTKQTNLEKYGVENVYQSKEIKNKIKNTKLKKYGDENYNNREKFNLTNLNKTEEEKLERIEKIKKSHNSKSREEVECMIKKSKQTKLEKYGDENYNNSEKTKQTNLEKYGVENVRQSNIIKDKIKNTKLEKYGDEHYNNMCKNKQTKLERYGSENYNNSKQISQALKLKTQEEKAVIKEKVKQTMLERYGVEHNKKSNFLNIENLNEDYVKKNFIKSKWFLAKEFREYFNIGYSTVYSYKNKFNILEPNKTELYKTQRYIFDNIKSNNKEFNNRFILDGKELDIYLPDIKLAIEYNGLLYHSEGYSDLKWLSNTDKNYHLDKTNQCLEKGIQLFHIFEGENLDLWLSMINNKLGLNERIFARKCEIRELSNKDIIKFLSENHIQGYTSSKINLGLFFQNKLVSVMTFSKPRFNKRYEYELIRFCSLKNTSVIGGANKLLKYFINKYKPKSIISYANRRFSNGLIYETLGFKKIGVSTPNYFYFNMLDYKLESRTKYQKHKLKSLLPEFDENLSEAENMFKNGYRRIYDCGNLVYELVL